MAVLFELISRQVLVVLLVFAVYTIKSYVQVLVLDGVRSYTVEDDNDTGRTLGLLGTFGPFIVIPVSTQIQIHSDRKGFWVYWNDHIQNKNGQNAFGWGRRVCSCQPLAEQSLFLVAARLVWALHVLPGLDEKGYEVALDIFAYTRSENMRPEPFKVRFIPHSDRIAEILRAEADKARAELSIYDGESELTMLNYAEKDY